MAGRATLAKSVIEAIPTYTMQMVLLPAATIAEIERAQRAFIWGHEAHTRKIHIISWQKILYPEVL